SRINGPPGPHRRHHRLPARIQGAPLGGPAPLSGRGPHGSSLRPGPARRGLLSPGIRPTRGLALPPPAPAIRGAPDPDRRRRGDRPASHGTDPRQRGEAGRRHPGGQPPDPKPDRRVTRRTRPDARRTQKVGSSPENPLGNPPSLHPAEPRFNVEALS